MTKWNKGGRIHVRVMVCSVQFKLCSIKCAVCILQCSLWSVMCEVCSVQCAVCSVLCVVCSVQYAYRWAISCPPLIITFLPPSQTLSIHKNYRRESWRDNSAKRIVQCEEFSVQSEVWSVQCADPLSLPSTLSLRQKQACCAGCRRRPFPMQLHQ